MEKERCVKGKGFNLETDVLAAKETGCAGILRVAVFVMAVFVMIVCQSDDTQQQDIAT